MDGSTLKNLPNPRERATPISKLIWWWTVVLFKKGYTKVLTVEDLYEPLKKDYSTRLGDRLQKQWNIEIKKAEKSNRQPNLFKTIFVTFWHEVAFVGMLQMFLEFVLRLGAPLILGRLLQYFRLETTSTYQEALIWAGALALTSLVTVFTNNHLLYQGVHLGGRIRIAVSSLVYRKALKLSKTALGETAPGKIVNLVANDVNRFEWLIIFLHPLWTAPLVTMIVAYILYTEAQLAALIGIAVLISVVPILVYTSKLTSKYRLQTAIKTDERVRLMDEIILGVQVIKMYAWEKPFCALVEMARHLELKIVKKTSYIRGLFMTFMLFTTRISLYSTIVSMLMFGQTVSAAKIFVFTSFYNALSYTLTTLFIRGIAEIAECKVSTSRIQSFLMLDEFREGNVEILENEVNGKKQTLAENGTQKTAGSEDDEKHEEDNTLNNVSEETWSIQMDNVTAKWYPSLTENTLENINLNIEKGKLYMVIGMVGSGKSSFLSSILGEINLVEGNIKVKGSISYASQDAWVFIATVRQNIIFGQEYSNHRYQQVVRSCSLYKDFEQFPGGDHMVVGERGSSLSGGQKARINLARAIYRQADIYLLDDPLSAVDAHVGKHLFEDCIKRYLEGKTRILATHQLQYVKDADGIILLDQGRVHYYSNYHLLLEAHPEYNFLIAEKKESNLNQDEAIDNKTELTIRRRHSSIQSVSQKSYIEGDIEIQENDEDTRNFKDIIESSSKGVIKGNIYLTYYQAGSNLFYTIIMVVLFLATQVVVSLNDYTVPVIVNAEESRSYYNSLKTVSNISYTTSNAVVAEEDIYPREYYIYFYTAVVLSISVIALTRSIVFYTLCLRSSERVHNSAFSALISTNLRFFDLNPSGRIINRFSKDTTSMDENLTKALLDSIQILLTMAGAMIVICTVNPTFLVPVVLIGIGSIMLRNIYLKTSQNVKRVEGMTRSPVFTHLNATLNGISTIRAYNAQKILKQEFDKFQDVHTSSWYMYMVCSMAYGFALDIFISCFTIFITFSFLVFKDNFNSGQVGLAITQIMSIAGLAQWGMRQSAEVSNQMMSVERILEYTQILPEKNLQYQHSGSTVKMMRKQQRVISSLIDPPKDWPNEGQIEFKSVYMRYSAENEPVLKDLSFIIKPAEKVGIVGRTGAGKSSLISALFRLSPLDGVIEIDGLDTGKISLEILRSHISIIPQDAVLFSGTLRRNLDPFEEFPDESLWEALEEVKLKDAIVASGDGLQCRVLDAGSNFSVGQRQLVCLARAVLRNSRILMLDEATANVDPQTDALIQHTIRTNFASCTVLTVAHRLNTIIDSDKVMVLDRGQLMEFDHPHILLQEKTSLFTSLVKETGEEMFEQLCNIAKQCYKEKYNDNTK